MNKKVLKHTAYIILTYFTLVHFSQTSAQTFYSLNDHYFLKGSMGGTMFFGDLSKNKKLNLMLSGQLSKKLGPLFIGSGQMLIGGISGEDKDLNLLFNAQIVEMNVGIGMDITNLFLGKDERRPYYVYGLGGTGLAAFWSAKRDIATNKIIQSKGYEGEDINYSDPTVERVIYLELGMHYKITDKWDLTVSHTIRTIDTDKLDAHYDKGTTLEGYSFFSVGMAFNFNVNIFPSGSGKSSGGKYRYHADDTVKDYNKIRQNNKLIGDPFKKRRKRRNYLFHKKKKLTL